MYVVYQRQGHQTREGGQEKSIIVDEKGRGGEEHQEPFTDHEARGSTRAAISTEERGWESWCAQEHYTPPPRALHVPSLHPYCSAIFSCWRRICKRSSEVHPSCCSRFASRKRWVLAVFGMARTASRGVGSCFALRRWQSRGSLVGRMPGKLGNVEQGDVKEHAPSFFS